MEFVSRITERFLRLRSGAIEHSNRPYEKVVKQIRGYDDLISTLSDENLKRKCVELKQHISRNGVGRNQAEYFALVGEVAHRTLGMKPYDVQMLAAVALSQGKMVEMQTGEGKTLAAVAPACLHAIAGRGSHILTFNDYLAQRDADWMRPIYDFMGFQVGHVGRGMPPDERRAAYASDITYVTAKEIGFDHLRDQLCSDAHQQTQREFYFAIIDEADSTVVDEARIPLVIAGEDAQEIDDLQRLAELVRTLKPGVHYSIQQGRRNANFEAAGLELLQENLGCGDLFDEDHVDLLTRLNLALQAELLLAKDVDYIVRDGRVELIDEFTGRVAENRRWPYGLQAAIEAKENVDVQPQGRILKSITLQHFLDQYHLLSGMTGTAQSAAIEIFEFFGLKTVVVPPNKPSIRIDEDDFVFLNKSDKLRAIVEEVAKRHSVGRPVLVGTSSVEESEKLLRELKLAQIDCTVLNAKNDQAEAEVVARAGLPGAVTISTNMAGRGTDIVLGGPDGSLRKQIVEQGGLYVIGTNRHESRRIDDQLRGRAGRQGDPGETRFFVSVEDELIHRCGVAGLDIDLSEFEKGRPVDDPAVGKRIARIQRYVESESFEIRRTLRKYTKCIETHRQLMNEIRQPFVNDQNVNSILQQEDPELFESLTRQFGHELVRSAEKTIAIFHIDECWADHLQVCTEIRNSIHLVSMGGFNAFDEFNKRVNESFRSFHQRLASAIVKSFRTAEMSEEGIDFARHGIVGPSSTWTYMINDSPLGDVLDRLNNGIKRMLGRSK